MVIRSHRQCLSGTANMFDEPPMNDNEIYEDLVLPFLLEKSGVRGRFVRLSKSVDKILSGHSYPTAISHALGEMLVVVAMLGSTIKTRGIINMQAQGSGAVKFIVADYTSEGHLRGYAGLSESITDQERQKLDDGKLSLKEMLGEGHMTITIEDELSGQHYQGIVELSGETLAKSLERYFEQSVQRDTSVEIAIERFKALGKRKERWYAGGVMLQRTPNEGGKKLKVVTDADDMDDPEEQWNRACMLLETVKAEELTDTYLSPNELLFRLFHEEQVAVYHAERLKAKCRCSRNRIERFLRNLAPDELKELENENGEIEVVCQFCNKKEIFTEDDFPPA